MKNKYIAKMAALALTVAAATPALQAQLAIPSADGSDGQLVVTSGTNIINLAAAINGSWTNTSASPGNGTYDPTQWAVVYKYTNVNISANAMVMFTNHPTHAPVVWLVNGNVTINGNLNLNGLIGNTDPLNLTEPGPGGFRGGGSPLYGNGPGFGLAGGNGGGNAGGYAGNYGNPQIFPLIGGSGGAGYNGYNGGGGGGAILIAATGTITINGYCHADGGSVPNNYAGGGGGGGIRLVAYQIMGNGTIEALGGPYAGVGRIRLEASAVTNTLTCNPVTTGVTPASPPAIFPATNAPTVTVLSVAGMNSPTNPYAIMSPNTSADDLTLVTTNTVTILLQTQNFPTTGSVFVNIRPRNSYAAQTGVTATFISGNTNAALWEVVTSLPYPGHTVIQAHATF